MVSLSSLRIATRSAIALAQTPDPLFSAKNESIAVIAYAYIAIRTWIYQAARYYMRLNLCQKDVAHCTNTESCMHT